MGFLSKIVSIVEVAVAVAAIATGVGEVAAAVTGIASTVSFASVFVTSAVLGAISYALAKKPETPSIAARLTTTRQPMAPWQVVYGQVRVGGVITFIETSSDNHTLWMVVTLAGHVCAEIGDIYLNDVIVPLDGDGNATLAPYAGYVTIKKSLGAEAGQPFSGLVSASNGRWTDAHRQTGRTKIFVTLKFDGKVFPNGIPNITAVIKGRKVYDPRNSTTAWSANAALCVADYLTNSTFGFGSDFSSEIDSATLQAAANVCDQTVTLKTGAGTGYVASGSYALGAVQIALTGGSGTILQGDEVEFGGDLDAAGNPNKYLVAQGLVSGMIVLASGLKTAIGATGSGGTGYVVSGVYAVGATEILVQNWMAFTPVHLIHANDKIQFAGDATVYVVDQDFSGNTLILKTGLVAPLADQTTFNVTNGSSSATGVLTIVSPTSESRYRANGAFNTSQQPQTVLSNLLGAMSGKAVSASDKWYVFAGAYEAPTFTITDSDLAGTVSVQSLVSRRESCNGVKGVFVSPESTWQPVDYPPVASTEYMTEDGGLRVWADLDLTPFVTSVTQAQRLAKIYLLKARQGLTASLKCKLTAYPAMTGHTLAVTNTKMGWSAKAFDVVSSSFAIVMDAQGAPTLGVQLGLRETAAALYDWTTDDESPIDLAPNTNLPDPWYAPQPANLQVSNVVYLQHGLSVLFSWDDPHSPYVDTYRVKYRIKGGAEADWIAVPDIRNATATTILGLAGDTSYDFAVAAVNKFGVVGRIAVATVLLEYPVLQTPATATVWADVDAQGNVSRMRVSVSFNVATNCIPDGVMVMLAAFPQPNQMTIVSGGTGNDLTADLGHVTAISTQPGETGYILLAGSTVHDLVVATAANPLPGYLQPGVYGSNWWCQLIRAGKQSAWNHLTSCTDTTMHFANQFYPTSSGFDYPQTGDVLVWIESSWLDARSQGTHGDYAADDRLAYLDNGAAFEILRWQDFYDSLFNVITCARGVEGTTPIAADGLVLHYFPAPGPGTTMIDIPMASFTSSGVSFATETDHQINIPQGGYVSLSLYIYRGGSGAVVRSNMVPATYGGAI